MSDRAVENPPAVKPGEVLDFCYRCCRLSAIGNIVLQQQCLQKIAYRCVTCGVRFAKRFELVKANDGVKSH
jgi:hypothetical protein